MNRRFFLLAALAVILCPTSHLMAQSPPAGLKYLPAKAYHIPPETTTEESGYFALSEGNNGKIYVGTAAYGRGGSGPR